MLPIFLSKNRIAIGILLAACLCLLGTYFLIMRSTDAPVAPLTPAEVARAEALPTTVEVADTPATRTQGLSGRASLGEDEGLLFVFDESGRYGFWMKDMQFAIDIIWIDADGRIVHIEHNLAPNTYPTIFEPANPARYALETRAGYARAHRWEVGTVLDIAAYVK